ncbi:MBL fold metallo-hydrolase [Phytobacter sp. RSE-02]|uniref:MBL fold metallo-hydrolase n=1 Tax=Phytobacter sp. RSE-02 TaxID=3229229 RepID=UPI00339D70F2
MKLTVLVDNNTLIDRYLIGEPGVSYLIECDGKKILFDTGYSDVFLKNAQILRIDLTELDGIVLSHGHNDHSGGLNHLVQYYDRALYIPEKKIKLIYHPDALIHKCFESKPIGVSYRLDQSDFFFERISTKETYRITEHITFLGQIPRNSNFETTETIGHTYDKTGKLSRDHVLDDSALVVRTKEGLVVVTGCSHSGISNIIEHAKQVTGETHIASVIGGFHLQNADESTLLKIGCYFKKLSPDLLYPCHCTDLEAKIRLSSYVKVKEVGVGLRLHFPV